MKTKIKVLIASLMLLSGHSFGQDGSSDSFTLQECIDYAMEHNQDVRNAAYEMDIAETQIKETVSDGLPQANIDLGINYNFEPQKSLIDISTFDSSIPEGTEQEVSFQQQYDGNLNLSVKQLIFDGSFFVGLQAARTFKELSTKDHIKTQIDVIESVSKAYYNALVTEERFELLEVNYLRIDSLLRDTRLMYENGFVEKIDVSRLRVQHNNLKVEVDNTEELLKLTHDLLKFQMGMPIGTDIILEDDLNEVLFDLNSGEEFSYNQRIEYSQLQTNRALVDLDMKNNKAQYLPNLYANFNYGYNTQTSESDQWFQTDRWLSFGFVGLSLNVPIFDGFRKSSRIQRNKIQAKQIDQSFQLLENSIDLEIKRAGINMSNALDNMTAQKENMQLAEDIYKVTKLKYQEGIGSNLEVIEADADFKESQTNYYSSLYDALIAKVELQKAYGTLNK